MELKVEIIGITRFVDDNAEEATGWKWSKGIGVSDGEALTEFAARACYQSWSKPNPKTSANADYLAHIEDVGHWSVMEHATVSLYIRGVSRSLTHELIRHRHLSPSQLSQRFVVLNPDVPERTTDDFVVPPLFEYDSVASDILMDVWETAVDAYEKLIARAEQLLVGVNGTAAKKRAREAARAVLPNMTPTAIVLTGNHRAWREMLMKRLQPEADAEIRRLAMCIFQLLSREEPALYQDLVIDWGLDADGYHTGDIPSLVMAKNEVPYPGEVVWDRRGDTESMPDEAESAIGELPLGEERPNRVL